MRTRLIGYIDEIDELLTMLDRYGCTYSMSRQYDCKDNRLKKRVYVEIALPIEDLKDDNQ